MIDDLLASSVPSITAAHAPPAAKMKPDAASEARTEERIALLSLGASIRSPAVASTGRGWKEAKKEEEKDGEARHRARDGHAEREKESVRENERK